MSGELVKSRLFRAAAVVAALFIVSGCSKKTIGAQQKHAFVFDGTRAYEILKKQCDFGPRYPGVKAHEATAGYIKSQIVQFADNNVNQRFSYTTSTGKTLELTNIYAIFNPNASRFVLLCAHWDTRPTADEEIDPVERSKPILGANDGASGVAVLLELARIFHEKKPQVGVVMAFFDGEDYGPGEQDMFLGAKEFAKTWKTVLRRPINIDYGVLLDMVGDKNLELPREYQSVIRAPKIVDKVWAAARKAGHGDVFKDEDGYSISDDHIPINKAGIKCIDVIDFNYAYWHTLDDTPDKCSAKSLQAVGETIEQLIYNEPAEAEK
jgi:hypothetical protein